MEDVTFFKKDEQGNLRQLSRKASAADILMAHSATPKLDNQKNGWKGVCIYQEVNGEQLNCPIRVLGWQIIHIQWHTKDRTAPLSAFYFDGKWYDITDKDIRASIKVATDFLSNTLHSKDFLSSESTRTPSEAVEPMPSHYQTVWTGKSKKGMLAECHI